MRLWGHTTIGPVDQHTGQEKRPPVIRTSPRPDKDAVRADRGSHRTVPGEGYWQPHPPPDVAAGPQHVAFSLSSQHVLCRSVLQHVAAAGCGGASGRCAAGASNSFGLVMVTP